MLTDTGMRKLRRLETSFKVTDRDGMYVTVLPAGTKSFCYDSRRSKVATDSFSAHWAR